MLARASYFSGSLPRAVDSCRNPRTPKQSRDWGIQETSHDCCSWKLEY